jgi:16S rRNA (cytidine1402-2'-O)-methyltransferase
VVIAREVTKVHEEFLRGRAAEVLQSLKSREAVKGEITLFIGKAEGPDSTDQVSQLTVRARLHQIMAEEKVEEKAALKKLAKERGISKSEAYRELQRSK